jgi:hypothetical protein
VPDQSGTNDSLALPGKKTSDATGKDRVERDERKQVKDNGTIFKPLMLPGCQGMQWK